MEKLLTGVAYHGNRILKHVEEDMIDIVNHNMNLVVHMFTHNDWDRHLKTCGLTTGESEALRETNRSLRASTPKPA